MHACIHTHIHACMHAFIHTYMPANIHTNTHTNTHTHTHTHTHRINTSGIASGQRRIPRKVAPARSTLLQLEKREKEKNHLASHSKNHMLAAPCCSDIKIKK